MATDIQPNTGITYEIKELASYEGSPVDLSEIIKTVETTDTRNLDADADAGSEDDADANIDWETECLKLQLHYSENFLVKDLRRICAYYKISYKRRLVNMKKDDLITEIIMFELNDENKEIVEERKRLWLYINELLENKYLKQFILWD